MSTILLIILEVLVFGNGVRGQLDPLSLKTFDLTNPTTWKDLTEYYVHVKSEKKWKVCYSCGFPKMGTTIHYLYYGTDAVKPSAISLDNLLTRLVVIDVSGLVKTNSNLVLTLDVASRWLPEQRDTYRPTLILFKFGWTEHPGYNQKTKCYCLIPGISVDVAAFISVNLGHVVGVGTDTPSLESELTRQTPSRTVSNILGKSGIYIVENVDMKQNVPEKGCLAMVMPLKLLNELYVPVRLTAICPPLQRNQVVVLVQEDAHKPPCQESGRWVLGQVLAVAVRGMMERESALQSLAHTYGQSPELWGHF